MILILGLILLALCIIVGGTRGLKTFITLLLDIFFCLLCILLIGFGLPSIPTTLVICVILTFIILFFVNGCNEKTLASFITVVIVLTILFIMIYIFVHSGNLYGFSEEEVESIAWCNYSISLNMIDLSIASIFIALLGSIIDTSTAISTAMYEVDYNNPKLHKKELFASGINVGKDVIGTITNTLFFAFIGAFLALMIWFSLFKYSPALILNNKVFVTQFISIMMNALGSLLVIPVTAYFQTIILKDKKNIITKITNKIIDSMKDE